MNAFIVSASGGQKPQFWANFDIWGLLYRHLFTDKVYSVALWQRKSPIVAVFELRHLVMSTVGGNLSKLNRSAQLQIFPYLTASKPFLYSNAFITKSGEQTLTFKSVTDRQKTQRFSPPRRWVKSDPHQTWYGDRGPRARSCTFKTFGV